MRQGNNYVGYETRNMKGGNGEKITQIANVTPNTNYSITVGSGGGSGSNGGNSSAFGITARGGGGASTDSNGTSYGSGGAGGNGSAGGNNGWVTINIMWDE